jgi:hypothetical protein
MDHPMSAREGFVRPSQKEVETLAQALRRQTHQEIGGHRPLLAWEWVNPSIRSVWRDLARRQLERQSHGL